VNKRLQRQLSTLNLADLDRLVTALIELLAAGKRAAGNAVPARFTAFASAVAHDRWIAAMLRKMRVRRLDDIAGAEELQRIVVALERFVASLNAVNTPIPADLVVDLLQSLRRSPAELDRVLSIARIFREDATGEEAIQILSWLFRRTTLEQAGWRIDSEALVTHIPGFGTPADPQAVRAFKQAFEQAIGNFSTTLLGRDFEDSVIAALGARAVSLDGILSSHPKNFPVFDLLMEVGGSWRLTSIADGNANRLKEKLWLLFPSREADTRNYDNALALLRQVAASDPLHAARLRLPADDLAARVDLARRSVLLVPCDLVGPLRAVAASHPDFANLVRRYIEAVGGSGSPRSLLEMIQPAP
jgi:hypothetical protein